MITKSIAQVYKHRPNKNHCQGWADVTIREWDRGGTFDCQSDWGHYSNSWGNIGDGTLREFLCSLDYGYFMEKCHPSYGYQYSPEKTIRGIKEDILRARRCEEITAEEARECFDEYILSEDDLPRDLFLERLGYTKTIEIIYGGDYCSVPSGSEDQPQCRGFWRDTWPALCKFWKEELKPKKIVVG